MGQETIVGQLRPIMTDRYISEKMSKGASFAAAWEGLFGSLEYEAVMATEKGTEITIDWQDGESTVHSAAEVWPMIFDSNKPWMLSANGTIFTFEKEAVIPGLLKRWYAERKEMQKKLKECTTKDEEEYWDKRQLVKKINLEQFVWCYS
jgi:DNA polymerase elongation subunit (family B)